MLEHHCMTYILARKEQFYVGSTQCEQFEHHSLLRFDFKSKKVSRSKLVIVILLQRLFCGKSILFLHRNTATDTVQQELLFVGQESGKLLAVRDIVQKVGTSVLRFCCCCLVTGANFFNMCLHAVFLNKRVSRWN